MTPASAGRDSNAGSLLDPQSTGIRPPADQHHACVFKASSPECHTKRLFSVTLLTALMDLEFLNPHVPLSLSFSRSRRSLLAGSLRRRGRLPPQPRAGLTVLDAGLAALQVPRASQAGWALKGLLPFCPDCPPRSPPERRLQLSLGWNPPGFGLKQRDFLYYSIL